MMMGRELQVVRVAGWEQYGWLRHGFSTRFGGVSSVYEGMDLNLGFTADDDAALVRENRRRFRRTVCGEMCGEGGSALVTVRQVHSGGSRVVRESDGALEGRLETEEGKAVWEADGLLTGIPGVLLGVQTADCVPVLVVDVKRRVVGAFHAGWRGTVARIVERGVASMSEEFGTRVEDLVAAVGPSIGACCYSVGGEVRDEFAAGFEYGASLFAEEGGAIRLDLWEANRRQLLAAGVGVERIAVVGECTGCAGVGSVEGRRYFSHRVERGVTGRMLSVVGTVV